MVQNRTNLYQRSWLPASATGSLLPEQDIVPEAQTSLTLDRPVVVQILFDTKVVAVTNIQIGDIRNSRYALRNPLYVTLEEDEEGAMAYSYDLNTYGYGITTDAAIQDLCESVVELYEALSEDKDKLAGPALQQFQYLSRILSRVEG